MGKRRRLKVETAAANLVAERTSIKEAAAEEAAAATEKAERRKHRKLRVTAKSMVVVVVALVGANLFVTRSATGLAYDDVEAVPNRTVAIVFGAFVGPNGRPSPVLADRIAGAIELYRQGKVTHLLMTGDNSTATYDEVTVMRQVALEAGVPPDAITRDYAGFNTYDSCARAVSVFGVRDAVLVTQDYHLSRALFLCRSHGIDAVGLSIPDWQHLPERSNTSYPPDLQSSYTVREWMARAKAVVDSRLTPEPTLAGPYEGLRAT